MSERGYPTLNLSAVIEPPKAGFWGTDERTAGTRIAVRIVRNGDVAKDGYIPRSSLPVRWVNDRERDAAITRDRDCILVSSGAYTGVTGKILEDTAEDLPVIVSNFVRRVRPLEGVDPTWLFHSLRSASVQAQVWPHTGGSAMPNLNRSFFERCVLPVPQLAVQGRISELLDAVDYAIRSTRSVITKLEQVKRGLLHDLVTLGIDEDGTLRDPAIHPYSFVDTTIESTPATWQVMSCQAATSAPIGYGIVQAGPYVASGVPVLMIRDLDGDFRTGLHRTSPAIDAAYARSRVRPGDVLLSVKATIGRVAVVPDWYEGNISRDMARLRPGPGCRPEYLRMLLSSDIGRGILQQTIVGTTRAEVSIGVLRRVLIPLPSLDEQDRMVAACEVTESRIAAGAAELAKLRLLKAGLTRDLLTGRVRVTLDEDAA